MHQAAGVQIKGQPLMHPVKSTSPPRSWEYALIHTLVNVYPALHPKCSRDSLDT
ncbi:hypothetical protein K443DRAFT_10326 [Laccaria amethystina LaAM-08-1]|uniref:Unplaced genomic scaffold K443scaffold_174, whole genome shotgun sequence n=1 Tax=Laccaria amethystina LaAM-08-1 TaxID=1095629 RepID=A0A0C9XKX7_9AGAR|nr:hypothetical protein K443DRAFT_10326 [Laccaria amethystina LaAM-08-1]